jgi:dihydroxyacetone kinase DhaKLM complex PTS-EIIA-like component DhaM
MNIKELAQQAGLCYTLGNYNDWIDAGPAGDELKHFAELVAAHEREECAKLMFDIGSAKLAEAIRARGKA